jgi:hypothetical protein
MVMTAEDFLQKECADKQNFIYQLLVIYIPIETSGAAIFFLITS